jgi:hypothetical protein
MRNLPVSARFAALIALALVACGPNAAELKTAKEARYKGDPATLFAEAKGAIEGNLKIGKSDPAALGFQTEGKWYTPLGPADTMSGGDVNKLQDGSINLTLVVRLVKDGELYTVQVEPIILRMNKGNPKPETLTLDNISVPGWVVGKVEAAQVEIHDHLKAYAVTGATVPAMVPAGPGSAAMPAAGAGAGSAAPTPAP